MAKKLLKGLTVVLVAFLIFSIAVIGENEGIIPSYAAFIGNSPSSIKLLSYGQDADNGNSSLYSKLCGSLPQKASDNIKNVKLYVGGMPFGVKFITEGVLVVGFSEVNTKSGSKNPALDAGLKINDIITKVNNEEISGSADLTRIVESSNGQRITLTYMRDGKESQATLIPKFSKDEEKFKSGMYVRDSGAGIGTVTFVVPGTYMFAGLGHGICDGQSGKLIPMQRGSVVNVTINGIVKGLPGSPGEVKGYFSSGKTGSLLGNTECGVFGMFASRPETLHTEPISICERNEVKDGKAYIYCTLSENKIEKYEIEISNIQRDSTSNKCFTVKVTDPRLLEISGGIVQGMSGSPIVQNGKIVGAVTHVLINDPTTGYGIFIENMLNAAKMPMAKAS